MTKALILDLGGVCVGPSMGRWNIPVNAREVLGPLADGILSPAYQGACQACNHLIDEAAPVADEDAEVRMRANYYAAVSERMHWNLSPSQIFALANSDTRDDHRYFLYEDVLPFLRQWKKSMRLGVLSDALPSLLRILEHTGIAPELDAAMISVQIGATKPDPRTFSAIVKKLRAQPEDCVFVDDRPRNILGARRFGIRAIQMLRPDLIPEAICEGKTVRNFAELDAML